jgi:hypothetical protein
MITKKVNVIQTVKVTVSDDKFTDKFMEEFRDQFYNFNTIDDHIKHLAQYHVRFGEIYDDDFIEGYGYAKDMGIFVSYEDQEEEIV